jgi:hypothetical protein
MLITLRSDEDKKNMTRIPSAQRLRGIAIVTVCHLLDSTHSLAPQGLPEKHPISIYSGPIAVGLSSK